MSNHTPGPWKAQKDCRSYRNTGVITDGPYAWGIYGNYRLALMTESESWISEEEVEANARLCAAAPDLLATLEDVELRACQAQMASTIGKKSGQKQADFLRGELYRIELIARAAVAKAKGD